MRLFKVKNKTNMFVVIRVKNESIPLKPNEEKKVFAESIKEIVSPVEIDIIPENGEFVQFKDGIVPVYEGKLLSGDKIKIHGFEAKDDVLNKLEEIKKELLKDISEATKKVEEVAKSKEENKSEEAEKVQEAEKVKEAQPEKPKRTSRRSRTKKEDK